MLLQKEVNESRAFAVPSGSPYERQDIASAVFSEGQFRQRRIVLTRVTRFCDQDASQPILAAGRHCMIGSVPARRQMVLPLLSIDVTLRRILLLRGPR